MADSTVIAIVSIGASTLTAILAPVVANRSAQARDSAQRAHELTKQERDARRVREHADADELRRLLDDCTEHRARASETYREIRSLVLTHGSNFDDHAREAYSRFRERGAQIDVDTARIAIRLGDDHALTLAHHSMADAMAEVLQHVGVAVAMGEHADLRETWQAVTKAGDAFSAARKTFTREAVRLAGSRLGGDDTPERDGGV
jgi:hypothetical protein